MILRRQDRPLEREMERVARSPFRFPNGTPVHPMGWEAVQSVAGSACETGAKLHLVMLNVETLEYAVRDPAYAQVLREETLNLVDSVGIQAGLGLLHRAKVPRV